jgi:hypothetical protein
MAMPTSSAAGAGAAEKKFSLASLYHRLKFIEIATGPNNASSVLWPCLEFEDSSDITLDVRKAINLSGPEDMRIFLSTLRRLSSNQNAKGPVALLLGKTVPNQNRCVWFQGELLHFMDNFFLNMQSVEDAAELKDAMEATEPIIQAALSAAKDPTTAVGQNTTMAQFFTPTRRFQTGWESSPWADDPFNYTEVALKVPVGEFLNYDWDWEALLAFVTGDVLSKIVWITDDVPLIVGDVGQFFLDDDSPYDCLLMARFLTTTSGQEQTLQCLQLLDVDVSTAACGVFWHAIMTSNCVTLWLLNNHQNLVALPSGPVLSQLLLASPLLQTLALQDYVLEEEHCRALATLQRTDLKITLFYCTIDPQHKKELESSGFITIK